MDLDLEQVVKLARIDLTPEEKERIEPQMAEILKYVEQLKELDVTDVEPTAHAVPLTNVLREDEVRESVPQDKAVGNAPAAKDGMFQVPQIISEC